MDSSLTFLNIHKTSCSSIHMQMRGSTTQSTAQPLEPPHPLEIDGMETCSYSN